MRPAALRSSYPSARRRADRACRPDALPVQLSIEELRLLLGHPKTPQEPEKGKTNNAER